MFPASPTHTDTHTRTRISLHSFMRRPGYGPCCNAQVMGPTSWDLVSDKHSGKQTATRALCARIARKSVSPSEVSLLRNSEQRFLAQLKHSPKHWKQQIRRESLSLAPLTMNHLITSIAVTIVIIFSGNPFKVKLYSWLTRSPFIRSCSFQEIR